MADAFNNLTKEQRLAYFDFMSKATPLFGSIQDNVISLFKTGGGNSSLSSVILKDYSSNQDKLKTVPGAIESISIDREKATRVETNPDLVPYGSAEAVWGPERAKAWKEKNFQENEATYSRQFVNSNPAKVITAGILENAAYAYAKKKTRGDQDIQQFTEMVGQTLTALSSDYKWDQGTDKEKVDKKNQFIQYLNKVVTPKKTPEGIQFTAFGEDKEDLPTIDYIPTIKDAKGFTETAEAIPMQAWRSANDMSLFGEATMFLMDHTGISGDWKYDTNIRNGLMNTVQSDVYGNPVDENGNPTTEYKPFIEEGKLDMSVGLLGSVAGLIGFTGIESAVLTALTPVTGGASTAVAAGNVGMKLKKVSNAFNIIKNSYNTLAKTNKVISTVNKIAKATTYGSKVAGQITGTQLLAEAGTAGVSTQSLIGNNETETQWATLIADAAQNYLSATIGNKIGDKLSAGLVGRFQFGKLKTALNQFDELVKSGKQPAEALAHMVDAKQLSMEIAEKLVDNGISSVATQKGMDAVISKSIEEGLLGRQFRALTTGFLGKSVTEITSDAILDGVSITGGNYLSRELTGKDLFTANTTRMMDLMNAESTFGDQLTNYLFMQSGIRAGSRGFDKAGQLFTKVGRTKISNSFDDLKYDYGLDRFAMGLSTKEVDQVSLVKEKADQIYKQLKADWKLTGDKEKDLIDLSFLRDLSNRLTVDKIVESSSVDGNANKFSDEARIAITEAVQTNVDLNHRLYIRKSGDARSNIVKGIADFVVLQSESKDKTGETEYRQQTVLDNIASVMDNTILDDKSTMEFITGVHDRLKERSADRNVLSAIAGLSGSMVMRPSGQATISRKSLKNQFSGDMAEFDVERAIRSSSKAMETINKVDLGITSENKAALLNFVQHLSKEAEKDLIVKKVYDSPTKDRMLAGLRRIVGNVVGSTQKTEPLLNLDDDSSKIINESISVLSKNEYRKPSTVIIDGVERPTTETVKLSDKEALEFVRERLRQTTAMGNDAITKSILASRLTIKQYATMNAVKLFDDSINQLRVDDPDFEQKRNKIVASASAFKFALPNDVRRKIGILGDFSKFTTADSVNDVERNVNPIGNPLHLVTSGDKTQIAIKSFVNQYGFTRLDNDMFQITTKSSTVDKSKKTIIHSTELNVNKANDLLMEYVIKKPIFSEAQATQVLGSAVLKDVLSTITEEGSFIRVVPIVETKKAEGGNKAQFLVAEITGTIRDGKQSNIEIAFRKRSPNTDNGEFLQKTTTMDTSVAGIMNTKNDVVRKKINDYLMSQMNKASNLVAQAEQFRGRIDFDKWIFNIAGNTYTLKTLTDDVDFALTINGITSNKFINSMLAGTEDIEQVTNMYAAIIADNLYDENGKNVQADDESLQVIQVAATQAVWEKAIQHGVYNKLVTSIKGDIREWNIRPDVINTWHNGKIVEVDIEYDMDGITVADMQQLMVDADGKQPDLSEYKDDQYKFEQLKMDYIENKIQEAGFVKLPHGFGNALKPKWLYISDLKESGGMPILKSIIEEAISDRLNMSLYPDAKSNGNPYIVASKYMKTAEYKNLPTDEAKVKSVIAIVMKTVKENNDAAIAVFEGKYPNLATGDYKKFEFDTTTEAIIEPYDKDTQKFINKNKDTKGRNDVITEFYNGLKDNYKNIKLSEQYIKESFDKNDLPQLVAKFALFGAETFSISTPAKRGSFSLISSKLDNTGTELTNLPPVLSAQLDEFITGGSRIYLVHSRTQDGMSWMPKWITNSLRSCLNSFDVKFTNQAIGSKLMTTDTGRIANQKLITQYGEAVISSSDIVLEFGSIKGYGVDFSRLMTRLVDKFYDGNALVIDPTKTNPDGTKVLNDDDLVAIKRLLGNITTHAVLTTRTKEGKLATQQMNTSAEMEEVIYRTGLANMGANVEAVNRMILGVSAYDAHVNPAMHLREIASYIGKFSVPSASAPAEVMQPMRTQDWILSNDQKMPFQKVIGSRALSVDLMYFMSKDKVLKRYSSQLGEIAEWLGSMHDDSRMSDEQLNKITATIQEILPDYKPIKGDDSDVIDFVMKVLSNEVLQNQKSDRMYAYVDGEYWSLGNRSPVVNSGQLDFFLVTGIRRGGQGVEMSADVYAKLEGGDYDGDTILRMQTSARIIKELYGLKSFKQKAMERQTKNLKRVEVVNDIHGKIDVGDYFTKDIKSESDTESKYRKKFTSVPIDKYLGALKQYPVMMYELGLQLPKDIADSFNNPTSENYIHDKMFIHSPIGKEIGSQINSILNGDIEQIAIMPKETFKYEGKTAFKSMAGKYEYAFVIQSKNGLMTTVDIHMISPDGSVGEVVRKSYGISTVAGMNKIIQDMSVSTVKTSSVQFLNEQIRSVADTYDINDPKYSDASACFNNPSQIVKTYMQNIVKKVATDNGVSVDFNLTKIMRDVVSAFSSEKDMTAQEFLTLGEKMDYLKELPRDNMPTVVRMALKQWELMESAGVMKKMDLLLLTDSEFSIAANQFTGGLFVKDMTADEIGGEGLRFEGIESAEQLIRAVSKDDPSIDMQVIEKVVNRLFDPTDKSGVATKSVNREPLTTTQDVIDALVGGVIDKGNKAKVRPGLPLKDVEWKDWSEIKTAKDYTNEFMRFDAVRMRMEELDLSEGQLLALFNGDKGFRNRLITVFEARFSQYLNRRNNFSSDRNMNIFYASRNAFDDCYQIVCSARGMNSHNDFKPQMTKASIKSLVDAYSDNMTASPNRPETRVYGSLIDLLDESTKRLVDLYSIGATVKLKSEFKDAEQRLIAVEYVDEIISVDGNKRVAAQIKNGKVSVDKKLNMERYKQGNYKNSIKLADGSYVTGLKYKFDSYEEYEAFVILHEMNHMIINQPGFKESPEAQNKLTKGQLEDLTNKYALRDLKTFYNTDTGRMQYTADLSVKPKIAPVSEMLKSILANKESGLNNKAKSEKGMPKMVSDVLNEIVCNG